MRLVPTPLVLPLFVPLLALATGCAQSVGTRDAEVIRRIAHERDGREAEFERARRALDASVDLPLNLEYEGRGTIQVHRLELRGGSDLPVVQVQFTYENTTRRPVPIPRVTFVYVTPDGQSFEAGSVDLWRPFAQTVAPGNAHTSWIDAPTGELHRVEGWTWTLEVTFPGEDERPAR